MATFICPHCGHKSTSLLGNRYHRTRHINPNTGEVIKEEK